MDCERQRLYKLKADVIAAAGHPIRLAIIDYLKDGEQCVCDIAAYVGAQRSNVSRHLAVLLNAGIVEQHKDGLRMIYTLRTPCILNVASCVSQVLKEQMENTAELLEKL